ncbi:MAG: hypothetical protein PHP85_04830 [Gallionella sp.]|nr:hypothetical protein [Gallionella sp.]
MLDAALRKLPGMLPNPLSPENLIFVIRDNDADIRAVAVSVYHFPLYQLISISGFFHISPLLKSEYAPEACSIANKGAIGKNSAQK